MWGSLKQAASWVSKGASISSAIAEIRENPVGTLAKVGVGLAVGAAVVFAAPYVAAAATAAGVSAAVVAAVAPAVATAATVALGYAGDKALETGAVQGVIQVGNNVLKGTVTEIKSGIEGLLPEGVVKAVDRVGQFADKAVHAANEFGQTIKHAGGFIDKGSKAIGGVVSAVDHARKGEWSAALNDVKSAVTNGQGAIRDGINVAGSATKTTTHIAAAAEIATTGKTGPVTQGARKQEAVVASLTDDSSKPNTIMPAAPVAQEGRPAIPVVAPDGQAAATDLAQYSAALVAARQAAAAARAAGVDARHADTGGKVSTVATVHNAKPKGADVQMA